MAFWNKILKWLWHKVVQSVCFWNYLDDQDWIQSLEILIPFLYTLVGGKKRVRNGQFLTLFTVQSVEIVNSYVLFVLQVEIKSVFVLTQCMSQIK